MGMGIRLKLENGKEWEEMGTQKNQLSVICIAYVMLTAV